MVVSGQRFVAMLTGMSDTAPKILDLDELARTLRLSRRWLREQARRGSIPSLRAGRQLVFNPDAVREAIARQALGDTEEGGRQ